MRQGVEEAEKISNSHAEVSSTVSNSFYDPMAGLGDGIYPFRFITKHFLRIDHRILFFCFREPCDPVPSFISFIVGT